MTTHGEFECPAGEVQKIIQHISPQSQPSWVLNNVQFSSKYVDGRLNSLWTQKQTDARRKMKRSFSTLLWRSIKATTSQRHFRCRIGLSTRSSKATRADSNHRAVVFQSGPGRTETFRPGPESPDAAAQPGLFFSWLLGLAVGLLFYASLCKCVNV